MPLPHCSSKSLPSWTTLNPQLLNSSTWCYCKTNSVCVPPSPFKQPFKARRNLQAVWVWSFVWSWHFSACDYGGKNISWSNLITETLPLVLNKSPLHAIWPLSLFFPSPHFYQSLNPHSFPLSFSFSLCILSLSPDLLYECLWFSPCDFKCPICSLMSLSVKTLQLELLRWTERSANSW